MHRPEGLSRLARIQFNLLEHLFARMIGGETAVVYRMPILRGDHKRKYRLEGVRHGNYRVAGRYRQRATGQEVVLNINQDECFHKSWNQAVLAKDRHDLACPHAVGFLQVVCQFDIISPRALPFNLGRFGNLGCHGL